MSKSKKKYYVVWEGHQPGIYLSWDETLKQVKNYPNARYKSFMNEEEAKAAFNDVPESHMSRFRSRSRKTILPIANNPEIIQNSICVDAACSGNPGLMEYRGVETFSGKELFHLGPLEEGTNNIGEFLAIVHALALFEKSNNAETTIYTDSKTAMSWVKKKNAKTKLARTRRNEKIFRLLERAVLWLHNHNHRNPIKKWETDKWGEIPADFGRK